MLFGGAADVDEVPRRAFEQNVGGAFAAHADLAHRWLAFFGFGGFRIEHFLRRVVHFAFRAAHHARDGERAFFVTDKHIDGRESPFHAVEGGEFLAILCGAGNDFDVGRVTNSPYQHIIVEGVQRLAQFEHGVVGRVHDVVDRTHARQFEPSLDVVGAGLDLHVADQSQHKARVERGVGNFNGSEIGLFTCVRVYLCTCCVLRPFDFAQGKVA